LSKTDGVLNALKAAVGITLRCVLQRVLQYVLQCVLQCVLQGEYNTAVSNTATNCNNTAVCTIATHCNNAGMSNTATHCNTLQHTLIALRAAFEEWKVLTRSNIALAKVIELQHNGEIAQQYVSLFCIVLLCVAVGCSMKSSDEIQYRSCESH